MPPSSNRTAIAQSVLLIARRVLENAAAGRIYHWRTLEWAQQIVAANKETA